MRHIGGSLIQRDKRSSSENFESMKPRLISNLRGYSERQYTVSPLISTGSQISAAPLVDLSSSVLEQKRSSPVIMNMNTCSDLRDYSERQYTVSPLISTGSQISAAPLGITLK